MRAAPAILVAIVLGGASTARAQSLPLPGEKRPMASEAASADERRWAANLINVDPRAYKDRPDDVVHFESIFAPESAAGLAGTVGTPFPGKAPPAAKLGKIEGVRATFGLETVERMKFSSVDDASAFAAHSIDTQHGPTLVEQRGDQIVVVRSPALRTHPEKIPAYRKEAWAILPASATTADSVGYFDGEKGEGAVTTRSGAVLAAARRTTEKARELAAKDPQASQLQPDGSYLVKLRSGFTARVSADDRGATTWFAPDAARADRMESILSSIGGRAPVVAARKGPATKGAKGALEGALGGK